MSGSQEQPETEDLWDTRYAFYKDKQIEVSVFLENGIKLNGTILAFDSNAVIISSEQGNPEGVCISRHHVATIGRARPNTKINPQGQENRPQSTSTTRR